MEVINNSKSNFLETVYEKADSYFNTKIFGKYACPIGLMKCLLFLILFFAAYSYFVFFSNNFQELLWHAVLVGICHVLIPVNIAHDAIHDSISSRKWINAMGRYGMELTGASSYMYGKKHLEAHFNKENGNKENSIELQGLLLQKKQKSATVNLPYIFYAVYAQYLIFIRDFILFYQTNEIIPRTEFVKLFVSKIVYATAFLVVPFMFIPLPWWQVLTSLMLMYLIVTVLLVIILLMPTEKMSSSKLDVNNCINDKWVTEILEHNVDFSPKSRVLNYIAGGANLNVVHYLFPSVNHVHYNKLAALVEETAKEYNMLYRKQNVKDVIGIHLNYLKNIQNPNTKLAASTNKPLISE